MNYADSSYDLEQMFPRGRDSILANPEDFRLGVVVGGSLSKGLVVKLDIGVPIEDLAVGRYVVVHGQHKRFFCMITDVVLDNTNPDIQSAPPDFSDPFLAEVYGGTAAYGKVNVQPLLSIDEEAAGKLSRPKPVKTIPGHFMPVFDATVQDVNAVFGPEDETHFNVGAPLELESTQINLDLKALVQRSIGVFGKSGTGKSFLTRMLLAGVIAKRQATALIFDMHNDYGWSAPDERGVQAKGLRQVLGADKVLIYSLDPESTRRRNAKSDFDVRIGFSEIEPEDFESLRVTMNLSDAMLDAARMLKKEWGADWIAKLIDAGSMDFDAIEQDSPHRAGTLAALQRRIQRFERWEFLTRESTGDSVSHIMQALEQERSIVLEFGRYGNSLEAYMLVANFLTRRIHELYVDKVEKALGDHAHEPPQLLIVIEEAHKFLDPKVANQTTFGIIAREMRKYRVTLLVVDQRPSGIDEEVMSQIGTRVTALLDNERDITAVLMGISGAVALREVLSRLDTKQQVIIMGHAVPMPVVVKTRGYDEDFYAAIEGEIRGKPIRTGNGTPVKKEGPKRIG